MAITKVNPAMLEAEPLGFVTPEMFGAVGDNETSDQEAWESTVSFAAMAGLKIFATGSYYVPDGVAIPSGTHIDGFGIGSLRSDGIVREAIYGDGASNCSVRNLSISIPRSNLRTGKFCIIFMEATNIRVDNVRTDGGTVGVWTLNCSDVEVTNCFIDTPKADGIHFGHGSKNCKAIGNTVRNAGDDAFSTTFYAGYSRPSDIVFANNTVLGTVWGCGIAAYSADNVSIANNIIRETALAGISAITHEGGGLCGRVSIVGNTISLPCRAAKQPESYWFGTDPSLDPDVTTLEHKCGMVLASDVASVKGNSISFVAAAAGGDVRNGLAIVSGYSIDVSGNFLHSVSGIGILSMSGQSPGALWIVDNHMESVDGVGIKVNGAITSFMVIEANKGGNGNAASGHLVEVSNTGSAPTFVRNNFSVVGRTCANLGGNGNYFASGNT